MPHQHLASNNSLIETRLVELESSSQAIRETAESIGHSGHNFDQQVKITTEELSRANQEVMMKSQALLERQGEAILLGLAQHQSKVRFSFAYFACDCC